MTEREINEQIVLRLQMTTRIKSDNFMCGAASSVMSPTGSPNVSRLLPIETEAPISARTSSIPVLVGFTST